jgi:asparagine synthase (glutamine-hydrolysing)
VIELCLAVPSWEWRAGGRDRALARRAFANDLPPAILRRRVKGGPDGFAALVLDRYRAQIRERLLDGELARHGIVERSEVERELAAEAPPGGEQRARILEFVAAEAWIDSWSARATSARSAPSA